jgi:alanine dehydrogenase
MIIGLLKEIMDLEFRVALTPAGAGRLVARGHQVYVEKNAGIGSGFSDREYREAGAAIVSAPKTIFQKAALLLKVKEPLPSEYPLLRKGQVLFTFLHLAANPALAKLLDSRGVLAIPYEAVRAKDGTFPILKPMSEIAGRLSVLIGASYLSKLQGDAGILISGTPTVEGAQVVILGAGVVGSNALAIAHGLGASVHILDQNRKPLSRLKRKFGASLQTSLLSPESLAEAISQADLVIGAVYRHGEKTPCLVSRKGVAQMKKGAVIVDVSIDQGGCFETSRLTHHSDPVYRVHGVLHYCVPNIPGIVPRTSAHALTHATLPFIEAIADKGLTHADQINLPTKSHKKI